MYQPSQEILKKYADILVKFALRGGEGVKKGDVVFVQIPECAKPFYIPLQQSILEVGGIPIFEYMADGVARTYYETASMDQITYYPAAYMNGKVDQMTHVIRIIAESDKYELQGIDSSKISARISSFEEYKKRRMQKETDGKMSWTAALYGTEHMAKDIGMSLEEYWGEIIKACYLDSEEPVSEWKTMFENIEKVRSKLSDMKIQKLHAVGDDMDLSVLVGSNRKWLAGSGCNIPSFEIFTSPDWRGCEGWFRSTQPFFRYGQKIMGAYFRLESGVVVDYDAQEGKELLGTILAIENANKLGEFSMTDKRLSRITKFMGETLYDENVGGEYGNSHIAIGSAFDDTYAGDLSQLTPEFKQQIGLNYSPEHLDFVNTTPRTVTATLEDGSEVVIYKEGKFNV